MFSKIRAMSLIEAVISMAILAIAFSFAGFAFYQSARYVRRDQQRAQAYFLAQEKLEELSTKDIFPNLSAYNCNCSSIANFSDFRVSAALYNSALASSDLANVVVTEFWRADSDSAISCNANNAKERFIQLSTLVANAG